MRSHDTSEALAPSRHGILFVEGHASRLSVDRGHLSVRSGTGCDIRQARFSKINRPRIRRVIVFAPGGGGTSWAALRWLDGIGAAFCLISRDGDPITTSARLGSDNAALRRGQAIASGGPIGLSVAKALLGAKLEGEAANLRRFFPEARVEATAVGEARHGLEHARTVEEARLVESRAAAAYWSAWQGFAIRFGRKGTDRVPEHWRRYTARSSPIARGPRVAVDPLNAVLNLLFALGEFEARLALLAVGLDPGLGFAHADQPSRDSAALDLLESIRPKIEGYAIETFSSRTFARRDFIERADGCCRIGPELVRELAETLPAWEAAAAPIAEQVAATLGRAPMSKLGRLPTPLTQSNRSAGREGTRRNRRPGSTTRPRPLPPACAVCGVMLDASGRTYCDECLAERRQEVLPSFSSSGPEALARMRRDGEDPMSSPGAKKRLGQVNARRREAAAAWDAEHERPDPEIFRHEILPGLADVPLGALMRATGLSKRYVWLIRQGGYVPHPRHWEALLEVARGGELAKRQ